MPLIQESEVLRGLKLRSCGLDNDAAEQLARAIAFNSSLESLDLRDNGILGKSLPVRRSVYSLGRQRPCCLSAWQWSHWQAAAGNFPSRCTPGRAPLP